jgi:hypothetical protein
MVVIRLGDAPLVGRVVATETLPTGPHQFHFWTATETPLGIGAIVRVDAARSRTAYAVVVDGRAYSDLATPLHDVVAAEGDPAGATGPTRRTEVRLWTAAVLRHVPEEPVQPVPIADVYLATEADVEIALRMDSYVRGEPRTALPIGLYRSGGLQAPVSLDANFLLGPESARHQDERGAFFPHEHFSALSAGKGLGCGGLFQRQGARSLFPRSAGGAEPG